MTAVAPPPPRVAHRQPRVAPVATAAAAVAGCGLVALVDPGEPGRYPVCPFRALTGLWCPACGSLRALHALLRGDLAGAVAYNVLLLAAIPALGYAWLVWASPRLGGPRLPRLQVPPKLRWGLLAGALAFGVARNLPGVVLPP